MNKQEKYEKYWDIIFVKVDIQSKNNHNIRLHLMLDTGCGKTQLSHEAVTKLGYSAKNGTRICTTMSIAGKIEGYILPLPQLTVFNAIFTNIEIAVFDVAKTESNNEEIDGLLGMDIISKFKLLIDGPNKRVKVV